MFGLVPFDRRRGQMQTARNQEWNLDRIFEQFFNDAIFPTHYTRSAFMKVDIGESDGAYWLEAELPGVKKEDVTIDVDKGQLTISVEHEETKEADQEDRYLRRERHCCSMKRSFSLENIDEENITAKMENGILRLTLPKMEPKPEESKKIDIQ